MEQVKKISAAMTAAVSLVTMSAAALPARAAYGVGGNGTAIMEYLDRGIYAVKAAEGMFVSWRFNANDNGNAEFLLYRDGELVYTSKAGSGATCYLDKGGTAQSEYRVDTVVSGKVVQSDNCKFRSETNYFDIPLNSPGTQYSPNDCCVGDVDGDGQYEIFVKWDPNNSQDNSKGGYTDNVYIDCVTLEGKTLWRVDLGKNIRAGQHYTQMCVADFDCDGSAELITKTADGTVDGTGKVIGDASKDYRNSSGYVLDGPEYMTLFDGQTGAALDTIDFPVPRGKVSDWGDKYGNRVDRMNGAIAYLDGVHPSAVYGRGYYTRLTLSAFDVVDKKLSVRWIYDTGFNKSVAGYGCGNHNIMTADVDDDGKQEICMGASMIDDDGKLLWSTGQMHGDAMHLGDLDPSRPGLELWLCHEEVKGVSLIDAKTGEIIFHKNADTDTGRCGADNVWAGNPGAEVWGARPANTVMDVQGNTIGNRNFPMNFFIYWDGDLERELLDGTSISKATAANATQVIFNAEGCSSNNSTKSVPCMTADLFGDWREELILRTNDNKALRVWCTTDSTEVRLTTLMHDMQYRMQNGCQQSSYNQPPHVSYYLGSDAPLPEQPQVVIQGNATGGTTPATVDTDAIYVLKNLNSSLYLSSEEDGNAVQHKAFGTTESIWKFTETESGTYVITPIQDSDSALTCTADGNITLAKNTDAAEQQFVLYRSGSGYLITPAESEGATCVEVKDALLEDGANVQVWERNGHACQTWGIEAIPYHAGAGSFLPGDVSADDKVNAVDLTMLKQMLGREEMGSRLQARPADVNADGDVTVADAVLLQKYLFGSRELHSGYYAAIDAAWYAGVQEAVNAGFHNEGYVNLDNMETSFLEFTVYSANGGETECTIRYANGSAANRIMAITVNNEAEGVAQDFESTGAWTDWTEVKVTLSGLQRGENTIRLTSSTAEGGPNLDSIVLKEIPYFIDID